MGAAQDKIERSSTPLPDRQDYQDVKLMAGGSVVRAKLHTLVWPFLRNVVFFFNIFVIKESYGAEAKDGEGAQMINFFPSLRNKLVKLCNILNFTSVNFIHVVQTGRTSRKMTSCGGNRRRAFSLIFSMEARQLRKLCVSLVQLPERPRERRIKRRILFFSSQIARRFRPLRHKSYAAGMNHGLGLFSFFLTSHPKLG